MRIAITGELGHIGSALFLKLIKKKKVKKVLLIDKFLTQRYPSLFNLPKNSVRVGCSQSDPNEWNNTRAWSG